MEASDFARLSTTWACTRTARLYINEPVAALRTIQATGAQCNSIFHFVETTCQPSHAAARKHGRRHTKCFGWLIELTHRRQRPSSSCEGIAAFSVRGPRHNLLTAQLVVKTLSAANAPPAVESLAAEKWSGAAARGMSRSACGGLSPSRDSRRVGKRVATALRILYDSTKRKMIRSWTKQSLRACMFEYFEVKSSHIFFAYEFKSSRCRCTSADVQKAHAPIPRLAILVSP